jgi:adenylyltransferase/sulfurtransferase
MKNHLFDRYSKQIKLPQIGVTGQQRLLRAKVLCVGAGGLGSTVVLHLAAAGIGTIAVMDHDTVSLDNLHRQIIYRESDIGNSKSASAVCHLQGLNSNINIINIAQQLNRENALTIIEPYDYIVDCTDNFTAKLLINDACHTLQKPFVSASVQQFQGQCGVFWPSKSPCLRCVYLELPDAMKIPRCDDAGVLGAVVGWFGVLQAMEILKLCLDLPHSLLGKFLHGDLLQGFPKQFALTHNPECPLCTGRANFAILWSQFANPVQENIVTSDQITVQDFVERLMQNESIFVLDVREEDEYHAFNIEGYLIPLAQLPARLSEIPRDLPIVVHCRSGHRSQAALEFLKQAGFNEVKNLAGGVIAWQHYVGSSATSTL